eukprot:GHVS01010957.1.p2 GENE.GHVS01010957.1~~GHVS01010957.1.p2  ORF type:complete len:212 (+),score=35.54 GHVS01010957.1:22-657(+)
MRQTKQPNPSTVSSSVDSLLTPATLVTFFRLLLILVSVVFLHPDYPILFFFCYLFSITLDYVDGLVARRLDCSTAIGSMLDVCVDIISRSILLCLSSRPLLSCFLSSIEWVTFSCTHQQSQYWKHTPDHQQAPRIVRAVMHNGLRSPWGAVAVTGLFGLPLWAYIDMVTGGGSLLIWVMFVGARCVAAAAEFWFIGNYIQSRRYEQQSQPK